MSEAPIHFSQTLSLRASGHVKRWHTITTLREQTVAAHSGQAVSLLLILHPSPSLNLVKAVQWHDCSERLVGDAPSPGLRAFPEYKAIYEKTEMAVSLRDHPQMRDAIYSLNAEERQWLRAIDVLEAFLFAREEIMLGNSNFHVVWKRLHESLNRDETPQDVQDFVNWFMTDGDKMRFA